MGRQCPTDRGSTLASRHSIFQTKYCTKTSHKKFNNLQECNNIVTQKKCFYTLTMAAKVNHFHIFNRQVLTGV